jgi:Tol biopolymer transport system component
MRLVTVAAALTVVSCGGGFPTLPAPPDGGSDASGDDAPADVTDASDAAVAACDPTKPFGAPVGLAGADLATSFEYAPTFSPDELTMWFSALRPPDASPAYTHIFVATRPSIQAPFGASSFVASLNGSGNDSDPCLSADGLTMLWESDRAASGSNQGDIYIATRSNTAVDFSGPTAVSAVNAGGADDIQPALDADGSLWLASNRSTSTGYDLFRAPAGVGSFQPPAPVTELNTTADDWSPTLSSDGLTIYFASSRPGGAGKNDIYVATRVSLTSPFSNVQNVAELNGPNDELPHWLSADGCRLYLEQQNGNTFELFVATRPK